MWQDMVFMIGSGLSIFFLAPTLRDATARVPLGTSLPSMGIGVVYGLTFSTMGMTFSAMGALSAGTMWALIALFRSPGRQEATLTHVDGLVLFARDGRRWLEGQVGGQDECEQFVIGGDHARSEYGHGPAGAGIGFERAHVADD